MSSLIAIDNEVRSLMAFIEDNDGEITEEMELRLEALALSEKDKVTKYCNYLDMLQNEVSFVKEKIEEASNYKTTLENRIERLLGLAKLVMERRQQTKIEGLLGKKLTLREYSSVEVNCPAEELPFDFVTEKTSYAPNKTAIKAALEKGEEIQGCKIQRRKLVTWK